MKKLVFKKEEAQPLMNFLATVKLKNKNSRLRNKLNKKFGEVVTELDEDRVALCKEHAEKDESGEPVVVDGEYKVLDITSLNEQIVELFAEEVYIEVGEYSSNFEPLFAYLDSEEFDMLLSGQEANCYDRLLDIWEDAMEQSEEGAN